MTDGAVKRKIFDGRYDILSIVGRGACSVVYHARHAAPPVSDVALKVLLNKKGERANTDRLRKEALAMVSSRHRYVIRLDDFHSVGDLCYLSMEYAPESDLRKFIAQHNGVLDIAKAERFLLQSAEALGFIHRAGIIHRDIKPDNILVMNDNEIRLADFGVAVLPGEESSLEDLQRGVGTMDYMAPEVLSGTCYDQRSDVYALAATFYEALCGKHPFANMPLMEQLEVRKDGKFADLSEAAPAVPQYLSNAIMKALSFDREQRYPTGREFLQAILVGKAEADKPSASSSAARIDKEISQPKKDTSPPRSEHKHEPAVQKQPISSPRTSASAKVVEPSRHEVEVTSKSPAPIEAVNPAVSENTPPPAHSATSHSHMEAEPIDTPSNDDHTGKESERESGDFEPKSSLPGIGIKGAKKSVPFPTPSGSGVRLKDTTRRETVMVSPSEVGVAREMSGIRPTVSIPGDTRHGGLATSATMIGVPPIEGSESQKPTVGFASNVLAEENAESDARFAEEQELGAPKGLQPKSQKSKLSKAPESKKVRVASASARDISPGSTQQLAKRMILAAVGGLALFVGLFLLFETDTGRRIRGVHTTTASQGSSGESLGIPAVTEAELRFPNLASGMYVGKITGLVPGSSLPLTIISLPSQGALSFLVGLPGWTPTLSGIPEAEEGTEGSVQAIEVASNGMILQVTGQVLDGSVTGFFRDLVSGAEGQWEATPLRGEAP